MHKYCLVALLSLASLAGCSNPQHNTYYGYMEGQYIYLASPLSGTLDQLLVRRGANIEAHAPAFVLDQHPEIDALQEEFFALQNAKQTLIDLQKGESAPVITGLTAQLARAKSAATLAKKTLARGTQLHKKKSISQAEIDEMKTDFDARTQQVKELIAKIDDAKSGARTHQIEAQKATILALGAKSKQLLWKLQQKTIHSPKNGLVFDTFFEPGELVPAGQAVAAILPPENIKALFFIPEKALSHIHQGQTIRITCDGCTQAYTATISFVSPNAEYTPPMIYSEQSRADLVYRIEAHLAPNTAKQFHPGQPITIKLTPTD